VDVTEHNRDAWNRWVEQGNRWTIPVSPAEIAAAREGEWQVFLTPSRPVPGEWLGDVRGARILCLASGGGQQGPTLAAAGALVTVLDNSPRQLDRDREVAARESLDLETELGVMTDLSRFADGVFDLVFQPVSNVFVPDVQPVWQECFRVLRAGGHLLAGFANPIVYMIDEEEATAGRLILRHPLPYSDLDNLPPEQLERRIEAGEPLEFGHTLADQLGGQIEAGFMISGFFEDRDPEQPLADLTATFIASRATKPPLAGMGQPNIRAGG
jgi:SAM-dependent methyltransferase